MRTKMARMLSVIALLMVIAVNSGCYLAVGGYGLDTPHHHSCGGYYQDRYDDGGPYYGRGYEKDRGYHRGWRDRD